jgi:hypothetical protein
LQSNKGRICIAVAIQACAWANTSFIYLFRSLWRCGAHLATRPSSDRLACRPRLDYRKASNLFAR